MSHGKLLLCCKGLVATLEVVEELSGQDDFSPEAELKMAEVAEKANHDISEVAVEGV